MANRSGYTALTIAILGWGASPPLVEVGLKTGMPAVPYLAYRFLLAALLLTPYMLLKKQQTLRLFRHPLVWMIGISESMGLIFQYLGQQQQVPAGLSALLSLLFLLIVPFLSPIILGEQLRGQHLLAVAVGLVGVVLIAADGDFLGLISGSISILGVVLLLLAAVGYAFYIVFTSKLRQTDESVDTFGLFYSVLVIVAVATLILTLLQSQLVPPPTSIYPWLILLVIFSTLIAFVAYFEAMKSVSANLASVLLLSQVLVAFILEFLFLSAEYSIWIYIGGGVIVVAMIIAVLTPTSSEVSDVSPAQGD
ncbi:MAG: DMT family transporter [Candidatus Kariarchaeaceae archaeon]|jgi:drug/metabolite transporter (DMT)-like permease